MILPKSLSISLCLFSLVKCELGGYFDSREMFCSIRVSLVVSTVLPPPHNSMQVSSLRKPDFKFYTRIG